MEFIQKGEIPFVRILTALISGIAIALLQLPEEQLFSRLKAVFAVLLVIFILFHLGYKKLDLYRFRWAGGSLFFLVAGLAGYLLTAVQSEKLDKNHFSRTKQDLLFAVILSEPEKNGDILRFTAAIRNKESGNLISPSSGRLLIALKLSNSQKVQYHYGDLLLIPSVFNEAEPPYNPFEFDFKAYLASKAIYHQTFINENQVKLLKRGKGNPVIAYALQLRQKLVKRFSRFIENKDAAAVASTLILGYRADLSREVLNAYAATGTMHVLSVSGMHVGILFFFLDFMLKWMNKMKSLRILKTLLLLAIIWLYALITGFSAAVCRAALMLSFVIVGKAIHRRTNTYNLLAISAVMLLIYNPYFLLDVGFQLSYLAVAGLIYFYPKIYHAFYVENFFAAKTWSCISLSLAAQLATFPLSMYYFHQFPFYFLLSNLFIILPTVVIMYSGLLFALLPLDAFSTFTGWILERTISFTNSGLAVIENLPLSVISSIWINPWEYVLLYLLIFLLFFSFTLKKKLLTGFSLLLVLVLASGSSLKKVKTQSTASALFYSLRKNTAIGFFEGRNAYLITDLNPTDKTFTFSVQPSLDAQAITLKQCLKPRGRLKTESLYSEGHFIQFKNWKMLLYDSDFNSEKAEKNMYVNAVLIRGNPYLTIARLTENITFDLLLIDGTNSDYNIYRWQEEAAKLRLKCYILKKNPALTVNL